MALIADFRLGRPLLCGLQCGDMQSGDSDCRPTIIVGVSCHLLCASAIPQSEPPSSSLLTGERLIATRTQTKSPLDPVHSRSVVLPPTLRSVRETEIGVYRIERASVPTPIARFVAHECPAAVAGGLEYSSLGLSGQGNRLTRGVLLWYKSREYALILPRMEGHRSPMQDTDITVDVENP